MKQHLVLFASGSGSNAVNVCRYFAQDEKVVIKALFCNNPNAGVISKMETLGIPVVVFNRSAFNDGEQFLKQLQAYEPDLICLLGFLWKVPVYLCQAYQNRILNLHPALLPKYGGKGMYGHFVHEAVKAAKEKESGISIHWVNEHYDEGAIIAQFSSTLAEEDTADDIAHKIHLLEQEHVPKVIEKVLQEL